MRGLVAFDKNDSHMFEKLLRKFNSVIDEKISLKIICATVL